MKRFTATIAAASFLALTITACNSTTSTTENTTENNTDTIPNGEAGTTADCQPLETRDRNVPNQEPTFPEQTRACGITSETAFDVVVVTKGLDKPWAVEPLPNGDLLVTEKPGNMRIVSASGQVGEPISGVPKVVSRGQGGLLDVALSPNFASDNTIYWSFSEPRDGNKNATSVAKGVLSQDRRSLSNVKVIFQAKPAYDGGLHFGSRLAFGPDGMLYVTLGERSDKEMRPQAQHMDSHMGKVLRITPEGQPAPDNPFLNQQGVLPEIWTIGHRNVQASAFDSEGNLWVVDHGPQGGDEVNKLQAGKNYGWPVVTYGEEYSGQSIPSVTTKEGFEDPIYYWDPVIAPSGAQFYTGNAFPEWQGNLFVGSLKDQRLVRLKLEGNRVTGEEHLLTDRKQRVRDVRQDAEGNLFIVTDQQNGELWKITPKK